MTPTAISTQQLADLAGVPPKWFTLHRADLPKAFDVPSTSPKGGRPAKAYSLEDIAAFILENTSFMTEAEVRLRVAMTMCTRKRKSPMARFIDAHSLIEIDGEHLVVPRDHSALPADLATKVKAAIASEHATTRARRCARRQTRKPTTPEGSLS